MRFTLPLVVFLLMATALQAQAPTLPASILQARKVMSNAQAALVKTPEWLAYEDARKLVEQLEALQKIETAKGSTP